MTHVGSSFFNEYFIHLIFQSQSMAMITAFKKGNLLIWCAWQETAKSFSTLAFKKIQCRELNKKLFMQLLSFAFPLGGKKREKRGMKLLPASRCGINGEFMPSLLLCSFLQQLEHTRAGQQLMWRDRGPCWDWKFL